MRTTTLFLVALLAVPTLAFAQASPEGGAAAQSRSESPEARRAAAEARFAAGFARVQARSTRRAPSS